MLYKYINILYKSICFIYIIYLYIVYKTYKTKSLVSCPKPISSLLRGNFFQKIRFSKTNAPVFCPALLSDPFRSVSKQVQLRTTQRKTEKRCLVFLRWFCCLLKATISLFLLKTQEDSTIRIFLLKKSSLSIFLDFLPLMTWFWVGFF